MKGRPHWPLARIQQLATKRKLFIQRTRALDFFPTPMEAFSAAKEVLTTLEIKSFAQTVKLTHDVADVYGVVIEQHGWYLKLTIDETEPEVVVISFHPLERPLKTRGGMVKP